MLVVTNPVQSYAWGGRDGLAALLGTEPTGGPEAELWIGAHPAAPSRDATGASLGVLVERDPERLLGTTLRARFGDRLPFLMKVLSVAAPLSIQLHPSAAQAAEGFAREEASRLGVEDPRRSYRDPWAKPEVLVALQPTWVLVGFRSGASAASQMRRATPALEDLASTVEGEPDARSALIAVLGAPADRRAELASVAARIDDPTDPVSRWVGRLAALHPGDPSALAPLLLELRCLAPGEGLYLPAGVPHAYLEGAGVEVMGASDNVVRGGLTPKHVDRAELVRLLAPAGTSATFFRAPADRQQGWWCYQGAAPELALHRAAVGVGERLALPGGSEGPALVVATDGELQVVGPGGASVTAGAGEAVLVEPGERARAEVVGPTVAWCATVAE